MTFAVYDSPALLTVGITGHRDLAAGSIEMFTQDVRRILTRLVHECPSTSIVFMTGLAEGADQLATEVALSLPGVTVIATLPMALSDYQRDFSAEALERFHQLLSRCSACLEVVPEGRSLDASRSEERDLLYQHFGRWLARNSHILIAGWDGSAPEFVGGTADNVYFKAAAMSPLPSLVLDADDLTCDQGLILWCPVKRSLASSGAEIPDCVQVVGAEGRTWRWTGDFGIGVRSLVQFNQETRLDIPIESSTHALFEAADGLANRLQRRYQVMLKLIMTAGVLAVASIDALQTTGNVVFTMGLGVFLATSVSSWMWLTRSRLRDRFQQARALAEGARIQSVWLAAGLRHSTAESFLNGQGNHVAWIRAALRGAWLVDRAISRPTPDFSEAQHWLDDQVAYFLGSGTKPGAIDRTWSRQRSLRRRATVVVIAAVIALGIDVVAMTFGTTLDPWFLQILRLGWSVGLGIGIAVISYGELMGYGQLSQRYALTAPYLQQGRDDLRQAMALGSTQAAQAVVRVAGVEALREAGDWLALHSQREVRPV